MAITRGEWTVNKHQVDSSPYEIQDSEGNPIAFTIYGQQGGIDEARDNAHLIAAAPDLLAACKAMLSDTLCDVCYEDECGQGCECRCHTRLERAREAAEAAIARVEGK